LSPSRRPPDPTANPYLAFSAMLQAGLDGIRNKIEPPDPIDRDLYELEPEQVVDVKHVPASLKAVLDALEADFCLGSPRTRPARGSLRLRGTC
jgi:glutamine synthetase